MLMQPVQSKNNPAIPEEPAPSDGCLILLYTDEDFYHAQMGSKFMLNPKGTLVGNQADCDVVLAGQADTPRKIKLFYDGPERTWMLKNLVEHKFSRTYVNGVVNRLALIQEGDNIQIGKVGALFRFLQGKNIQASIYDVLQHRIEQEKKRADTDTLTQIPNRGAMERELAVHIEHCRQFNRPLSLIFFDIDFFKHVNNTYKHPGGDAVLVAVAGYIQEQIRPFDVFCRWGGEEFAILLREADQAKALGFAERIRALVEATPIPYLEHSIHVTISMGVATLQPGWDGTRLVNQADHYMMQAKNEGRNRVLGTPQELG